MEQDQNSQEQWMLKFKNIITAYTENRAPDPFMIWFRQRDSEGFFADNFERVLAILIDARFDQRTTAEKALENTVAVVNRGALKRLVNRVESPLLIPRENMTAEKWTDLFCSSLPRLHELARRIVAERKWDAAELLDLMLRELKVPYLGVKTSRLAVRWLHELVPNLRIDMTTYKIPVDALVYRVVCRLGIIDPNIDKYFGEDSPADLKIQSFVKQVSPDKPWLLDEPLWSTGRRAINGGHCFPQHPNHSKCLFESVCLRRFLDIDPAQLGMDTRFRSRYIPSHREHVPSSEETAIKERQAEFAKFVEELKQKGITGEKYREKITQWNREHQGK